MMRRRIPYVRRRAANVRFAAAGLLTLALAPAPARAVNIALPGVNPNGRVTGTSTFGTVGVLSNLNDGTNPNTTEGSMFQVPPSGSKGFGYDLGGVATIQSLDLSQYTSTPIGVRSRLQNVLVYTAAGSVPFALPDQDDVTLTFPTPVTTSWLMVQALSQHPGNDAQIGIDELAVNSAAGITAPARTNVARGKAFTLQGPGWNNVNGNLTDNVLAGANTDLSTAMFNSSPTTPGVSIDIDLLSPASVNGIGLAEHDYGGAGGRQLIETARLEFSNDPSFATVTDLRTLALQDVPYQQVEFPTATGRYVRLSAVSQYGNRDANLGFIEVQLYQVPEPSTAAAGLLGLALLGRRRKVDAVA